MGQEYTSAGPGISTQCRQKCSIPAGLPLIGGPLGGIIGGYRREYS